MRRHVTVFAAVFAFFAASAADARNVFYDPADQKVAAPVERVTEALWKANSGLCTTQDAFCVLDVHVNTPNAIEAFYSEHAIWLSTGRLQLAHSDAELALLIGHEWAHHLLGHPNTADQRQELVADCVGALIAARSGYDLRDGVHLYERLAAVNAADTAMLGLLGIRGDVIQPSWASRIDLIQHLPAQTAGKKLERADIEHACRRDLAGAQ